MKVTIITPVKNGEATIKDTLVSIVNQDYIDIQQIIVDGGSSDATLELISKHAPKATVIQDEDEGLYDAMNKGIFIAQGEVIGILNSDDVYSDNKVIADVVKAFQNPNVDLVYGDLKYRDADLKRVKRSWKAGPYSKKSFLKGWMPPHPTVFVRKEVYQKLGSFRLDMGSAADYEILLRWLYKNDTVAFYLDRTVVDMRIGGVSNASIFNRLKAHFKDYRAWKVNQLKPKWYTLLLKPLRKIPQYFKS